MKVLFLDVDGVLNHEGLGREAWERDGHRTLDPACCERVRQICDRTGARIVVSSTWRFSSDGMAQLLQEFGGRIIGVTPCGDRKVNGLYEAVPRRDEIQSWMLTHAALPLEVCAVDDDEDADISPLPFVRTSAKDGLTERHAKKIEHLLGLHTLEQVET